MRVILPSFEILDIPDREAGIALLRRVEYFARISHRSEDKQTPESWERFIRAVIVEKADWSVAEHEKLTVVFRVDRGCTHEIVRHRIFAYTQESTRFVNYGKKEIEFVEPVFSEANREFCRMRWHSAMVAAEEAYLKLLEMGEPPQMARSILPNATASTIAMTGNLRSWRQFVMMRSTRETHPDLRRVVIPLLKQLQERIPLLYDDIEPEAKQSVSLSKPR